MSSPSELTRLGADHLRPMPADQALTNTLGDLRYRLERWYTGSVFWPRAAEPS